MARAERHTVVTETPTYYSDFLINFNKNPITGLLARATNEEAVKNSIKQIVLTINYERPYNPDLGSKVNALLFEPIDDVTKLQLEKTITTAIKNFEPRCNLIKVSAEPSADDNAYFISITFSLLNIPNQNFTTGVILKRVR